MTGNCVGSIKNFQVGAFLLLSAIAAMIAFMWKAARSGRRLRERNEIHGQTLAALILLTVTVTLGYAFFLVFGQAYSG